MSSHLDPIVDQNDVQYVSVSVDILRMFGISGSVQYANGIYLYIIYIYIYILIYVLLIILPITYKYIYKYIQDPVSNIEKYL